MFIPPAGVLPPDPMDPASPLKKILLWNGASSWGGIRSVPPWIREGFIKKENNHFGMGGNPLVTGSSVLVDSHFPL